MKQRKSVSKTTKHQLYEDEEQNTFYNECPMHKMQKLDESDLLETSSQVLEASNYSYDFKEIDFNLEPFHKEQSAAKPETKLVNESTSTSFAFIKNDKILSDLNHICDKPIQTKYIEEDNIFKKEIHAISDLLKDTTKLSHPTHFAESDTLPIENLRILFNSLTFKNYDFSNGAFNSESATILYEQLYKVNVYISKTTSREFLIYFGFPFYLSIRINMFDKIFTTRKNINKLLQKREEIDKIIYYSTNMGVNLLDVITATRFIYFITKKKYFTSGFDLISKLLLTIKNNKINYKKLIFNKVIFNFDRFIRLYKQILQKISMVSILD